MDEISFHWLWPYPNIIPSCSCTSVDIFISNTFNFQAAHCSPGRQSQQFSWSCSPKAGNRTASPDRPRSCFPSIRPQDFPVSGKLVKKVGFQKSPWKPLCRPLCVGPCQRSYTPRLPRWMLPTWEIVTLIGVGTQKKKRKLDCNVFVVSNEPRRGKMTTSWQHYISLHSPYHNDISWRNSMKWISSGSPSVQLSLKGFWRSRRGAWGEKITWGASSWRGKKLLMACAACKKSDVVGLPPHLLAKAQYRKNS